MKKYISLFTIKHNNAGFTVIEMIVVIAIFGIFAGVLLFNYRGFQNNTDFSIFAQEFGLLIKKTQQDAMSGFVPNIDATLKQYPPGNWRTAYGVYMETGNNEVIIFYDQDQNGGYTSPSYVNCDDWDDECLQKIQITDGRAIADMYMGQYQSGTQIQNASVVFTRPYPDASMRYDYQNYYPDHNTNGSQLVTQEIEIGFSDPKVSGITILTIHPSGTFSIRRQN